MNLSDCEVAHRHVRGHNAIFIFGPRALTADERAALAVEYAANYGEMDRPAYFSPAGWQLLHDAPEPKPEPQPEPEPEVAAVVPPIPAADEPPAEKPADPPAEAPPVKKKTGK